MNWLRLVPAAALAFSVGPLAEACGGTTFAEAPDDGGAQDSPATRDVADRGDVGKGKDTSTRDHATGDVSVLDVSTFDSADAPSSRDVSTSDVKMPADAGRSSDAHTPDDAKRPNDATGPKDAHGMEDTRGPKDAGGGSCTSNNECPEMNTECAFLIADECQAKGVCVMVPPQQTCGTIMLIEGCSCTNTPVSWAGGCKPQFPDGYAPVPIQSTGLCTM